MLSKVLDVSMKWCFFIGAFLIGAMGFFITYDVIVRYAFARPNIWAMQMSEYIMVYATFLAAAWVLKNEGHVRLGLVIDHLKPKPQAVMGIITSIMGTCICLILLWQSADELVYSFQKGLSTSYYPWNVIEWPTLVAVPLGSLLLSLQFIRRTYGFFVAFRKQGVH